MISDNLIDIKRRIDSALLKVGRKPESCTLIGVSKTKPISQIKEAYSSGLRDFGENYVEEFFAKHYDYHPDDLHYHFIGRLPTKKVRKIVGKSSLIHSISSLKLAKKVDFVSKDVCKKFPGYVWSDKTCRQYVPMPLPYVTYKDLIEFDDV